VADEYGVELNIEGDVAILILRGEIDLQVSPSLVQTGEQALLAGPAELVVDLSGTTFLDSGGIGAIVQLRNRALESDTRVILRPGPANVMRVLEIVGLDTALRAD
jgi:anti-sigma B factor antagonist